LHAANRHLSNRFTGFMGQRATIDSHATKDNEKCRLSQGLISMRTADAAHWHDALYPRLRRESGPVLLAGDFNFTNHSPFHDALRRASGHAVRERKKRRERSPCTGKERTPARQSNMPGSRVPSRNVTCGIGGVRPLACTCTAEAPHSRFRHVGN
jgi:endonuclease/exonuclease/phosphatase family metal-dependent hydrolase